MDGRMRNQTGEYRYDHGPAPLIGREQELGEVLRLLGEPGCRLLTLAGPGGIGKTRLCLAVVERLQANAEGLFPGGVYFVPLEPLMETAAIPQAIAEAAGLTLSGAGDRLGQVVEQLRGRQMLLALDNLEHLPGAADLLLRLLRELPELKLLATSREVLHLQQEWLYPLQGLEAPPQDASGEQIEQYGAAALYAEHARRVQRDFSLADEAQAVARLCRLVEGLPLALELAAAWRRTLSSAEIAGQIERQKDFLASSLQDLLERHRSLRAVFEHSWAHLDEDEQAVFRKLAVFQGGFTSQAAEEIAGAELARLAALVDQSLLRREPGGRYQIHGLLQDFALERLEQDPQEAGQVRRAYSRYYLGLLAGLRPQILALSDPEQLAGIRIELENIRRAWEYAVANEMARELRLAGVVLDLFFQAQGRYSEGKQAMEAAAEQLAGLEADSEIARALAETLVMAAWFNIRLGTFERAGTQLERARNIYRGGRVPLERSFGTDPRSGLAVLALLEGDYQRAIELSQELRGAAEEREDLFNQSFAHYTLNSAYLARGDFEQAQAHGQQAVALARRTGDRWFLAYPLIELGSAERALKRYERARQLYSESYKLRERLNDPEGMALALNHLGRVAILQGQYRQAQERFRASAEIYRGLQDQGGLAEALNGLGTAACKLGRRELARDYFRQALRISVNIGFVPQTLNILVCAAELLLDSGQEAEARMLLETIGRHPSSEEEVRDRAGVLLQRLGALELPAVNAQAASAQLEQAVQRLRLALQEPQLEEVFKAPEPEGGLIEPLTEREQEVLELIAAGLSNQAVAEKLVLSTGTVKWYTSQIYQKLGVSSRTQAVAAAREKGLLPG